jgi:hypothetical protein
MNFILRDWIYVDNMEAKFQVQKIHKKKDIRKKVTLSPKNIHKKIVKLSLSMTHVGRFQIPLFI